MSKEQKFIDTASDVGPLPGFIFANPIFNGFFCMFMCAVFGAFMVLFRAFGRGVVESLELFEMGRWGAIAGLIVGAIVLFFIFVAASFRRDQGRADLLLFVLGGILGIAALVIADRFYLDEVRTWLSTAPPLMEKAI